jgi:hypothetical protein
MASVRPYRQGPSSRLLSGHILRPKRVSPPTQHRQMLTCCLEPIDAELSKKLAEELKLESGMDGGIEIPSTVTDYLENGPFKVNFPPRFWKNGGIEM